MKKISVPSPAVQKEVLVRGEWELHLNANSIPKWQLLAMLHYEYARCYKPVLSAVEAQKKLEPSERIVTAPRLAFALYLAHCFPEFPRTPWTKIDPRQRMQRLKERGINETTEPYGQESAWFAWDLFDAEALELKNQLIDAESKSYGVFKVNFQQEDATIVEQFSVWLKSRRESLLREHNQVTQFKDGRVVNANRPFQPQPKVSPPPGRGNKTRRCLDYLKALGGLRALKFCDGNWEMAEMMTSPDGGNALYRDQGAWHRSAAEPAGVMMRRLALAWKVSNGFYDIFDHANVTAPFVPAELTCPLPTSEKISKEEKDAARALVARNFSLEAMSRCQASAFQD